MNDIEYCKWHTVYSTIIYNKGSIKNNHTFTTSKWLFLEAQYKGVQPDTQPDRLQ